MPRKSVELMSPRSVYNRVVIGALFSSVGLWMVNTGSDEQTGWVLLILGGLLFISGWKAVMNPAVVLRYAFGPQNYVLKLLEEWHPPQDCSREVDYERALHKFLKQRLPFLKVTRQYGSGRVKWDLAVGKDVMIELKVKLKSTSKLQRLIGQLDLYKKELDKPMIIVLFGEAEDDLLRDLQTSANQYEDVTILTKEVEEAEEEEAKEQSAW